MSRLLLLMVPLLLACGSSSPPPGELIGTFSFRAILDETAADACPYPDSPDRLDFQGTLSWERESGQVWLSIGDVIREGTLDGNHFLARLPGNDGGGTRAIPRKLRGCDCDMTFRESFEVTLVDDLTFSCRDAPILLMDEVKHEAPQGAPGVEGLVPCPQVLDDGTLDWGSCGGLCGALVEQVTAPDDCVCKWDAENQTPPSRCEIRYKLRATRVGGRI